MNKVIAIPVDENGILDAHFGHCKFFVLTKIEDRKILSEEKIVPPPHEPGVIPKFLANKGATDIIAGGMGKKAIEIFNTNGVNVFVGAPKKNNEELIAEFISETLSYTANYCDH